MWTTPHRSLPAPAIQVRHALRALRRTSPAVIGSGVILVGVVVVAIFAPYLSPTDPLAQDLAGRLQAPSDRHPLGTDGLGRDVLSRIIYGSRVSVVVGVLSVMVSSTTGVALGLTAGYYRRWVDDLIMRVVDIQQAFPPMVLAIALAAVLGPGLQNVILVLAVTRWIVYARIIRAEVLSVREREYVEAARAAGATNLAVMIQHILPNTMNPVLVVGTLEVSRMIILESSLSFLGLGVRPPTPTWGSMISDARDYLSVAWWIATFPGLAIFLTVLSVNLIGDWLRERMDPRARVGR